MAWGEPQATARRALELKRVDAEGARPALTRVADLDGQRLADAFFAMSGRARQDARENGLGNVGAAILPLGVQQTAAPARAPAAPYSTPPSESSG